MTKAEEVERAERGDERSDLQRWFFFPWENRRGTGRLCERVALAFLLSLPFALLAMDILRSAVFAEDPDDIADHVVINEIAWMGTKASYSDEWIELKNNTDSPIDIGSWSIYGADTGECLNFSDADGYITTTVPANGYLIYASHADDIKDSGGTNIVDIWDATIIMNNTLCATFFRCRPVRRSQADFGRTGD
ncbi:MAG: lamin tail domain-containing protein [Chloroflexota bacterium]|nr:lamin tail domain-containing protein [Chloroflexota bacterium]